MEESREESHIDDENELKQLKVDQKVQRALAECGNPVNRGGATTIRGHYFRLSGTK